MAQSFEQDGLSVNFTEHFDPATTVPEPPVSDQERKHLDEIGIIGAGELNERGFFTSVVRRTRSTAPKAPAQTTILVIEDDTGTAELIQRVLEKVGYLTRRAGNRAEIVQELGRKPPADLILLDVMLPNNLNGFDVLNRIRQHPLLMHIPVVMLTSLGERLHIVRGLALGADGYVTKPARPTALADMVQKILSR
jgi:two-component system OmpR family response regulator